MTWRRLGNLVRHLPAESATMTAIRVSNPDRVGENSGDPADGRWSQAEMLLADAVDTLRNLLYAYTVTKSSGKGAKPKPPDPIRRPGVEPRRKKPALDGAQADFLFRHINGLPQDPDSPIQLQVIDGGGGG